MKTSLSLVLIMEDFLNSSSFFVTVHDKVCIVYHVLLYDIVGSYTFVQGTVLVR